MRVGRQVARKGQRVEPEGVGCDGPLTDHPEAGGMFTDWSGCVTALGGGAIAMNRRLCSAVREVLR
jgi:hypothetical protein